MTYGTKANIAPGVWIGDELLSVSGPVSELEHLCRPAPPYPRFQAARVSPISLSRQWSHTEDEGHSGHWQGPEPDAVEVSPQHSATLGVTQSASPTQVCKAAVGRWIAACVMQWRRTEPCKCCV
ncbi:hypothetical protein GN956_G3471 [Arapaima gigas]